MTSPIMQNLESGGIAVVKGDWRNNITEDLRQGNCHVLNDFTCHLDQLSKNKSVLKAYQIGFSMI